MKKMTVRICALIAIMATVILPAVCRSEEVNTQTYWVICDPESMVNAREKATTKAPVAGRMTIGDAVEVIRIVTGKDGRSWAEIDSRFESQEAFILAKYLTDEQPETVEAEMRISASGRVALRFAPNGDRKKWLKPGQEVYVHAIAGEWAVVDGGYIKSEYLQKKE